MIKVIPRSTTKAELGALILIFSASLILAHQYIQRIDIPYLESRFDLHHQIIQGSAPSPYRYRVLLPFAAELAIRTILTNFGEEMAFFLAYAFYQWIAILLSLVTLFFWLRFWFENEPALIGVLFAASTMPIAFQDHYFQPWSLLEPALFSFALIAIRREKFWILAILVFLASLNRETAVFLPLTFLAIKWENNQKRQSLLQFGYLLLIWSVTFWGLRYLRGNAPHVETLESLLMQNLTPQGLFDAFLNVSLFLGGFWMCNLWSQKLANFSQKIIAGNPIVFDFCFNLWSLERGSFAFTVLPIFTPVRIVVPLPS
ncbi:MAG: hypothetical protein WHS87_10055 [Anaerolineales bacterium]